MTLPSGERLAECTGTECRKAGGWLTKLGEHVGERIVGAVMTERQVRAFYKQEGR